MLEIEQTEKDRVIKFALKGRLDGTSVEQFDEAIDGLSDVGNGIVVDCTDLEGVSGLGFEVLARLSKITKAFKKDFRITNVSENIYYLFEVTGFTEILKITKAGAT